MPTDQETRLQAVLDQLENNQITLADAAREVRTLHFPPADSPTAWQRQQAAYGRDMAPPPAGSFFMVSQAYTAGRISRRQYEILASAAADAMQEKPGNASV